MAKFIKLWDKFGVLFLIAIEIVVFTLGNPNFISSYTLLNVLRQGSVLAIAALGYGMFLISGVLNLSIGSVMGLAAVSACSLANIGCSPIIVIIITIAICCVCSILDSGLSNVLNVDPFLMTMATSNIWSGLAFTVSAGLSMHLEGPVYEFLGGAKYFSCIPFMFFVLVLCIMVAYFIMNYTHDGRNIYALGGNVAAAYLNGINVKKTRIFTAAIAGAFMGIATLLLISRNLIATASMCSTVYIDCLTAAVLGGVSVYGGTGKIQNILLGVAVLQLLNIGLQMMGVSSWTVQIIKGLLLIFAFLIEYLRITTKEKMLLARKLG